MTLAHLLLRQAVTAPDRPAILHGTSLWATYAQWAARCSSLSQHLLSAGLHPGDRVVILMRNHPRYLEILWGCWWAGLVVVPINMKLHSNEVEWIVNDAQARWAFVTADTAQLTTAKLDRQIDADSSEAAELFHPQDGIALGSPTESSAENLAWLFYTSGTTGRPKGVMLTHRNLMIMGLTYFVDVDSISADDAFAYAAPMSHGCGMYAIPHLMAGARHVVPVSGAMDPAELFTLGRAVGPVSTFATPTIVKRLVDHAKAHALTHEETAASFKTIVYGGGPMYLADIQRALRVMGPRFAQIYGQGETPMVATALSRQHISDVSHVRHGQRLASVGVAQTPVQVRVSDEQGRSLPPGEVGEVLVRGDTVMAGYWQNPEATAAALREGWLWTGDLGYFDEDGFLTLKDRSKDLVISGGSNIYPREVEEVLLSGPGVAEVAVVGAPDPEWGEVVVAFVVPVPGQCIDEAALDALCIERIARYKRPRRYLITEALPKNHYGKVLKTELRARLRMFNK